MSKAKTYEVKLKGNVTEIIAANSETDLLDAIVAMDKIDEGTVTTDDFNDLISEATPESMRDRLRRRPMVQRDTVKSHQDEDGHADTKLPKFSDRVDPKREREGRTQMNGRGRAGHRHSARTQKRTMGEELTPRLKRAIRFIKENYGKPVNTISDISDRIAVVAIAKQLMAKSDVNRDWLEDIVRYIGKHDAR